jgi:hypothetical protein
MKKIIILVLLICLVSLIFATEETLVVSPTVVPVVMAVTKTVKIPVKVKVKKFKGAFVVDLGTELSQYIVGASYIYNSDKSSVIVVLDVPEGNVAKVTALIASKKAGVKAGSEDLVEKEFRGFKANYLSDK